MTRILDILQLKLIDSFEDKVNLKFEGVIQFIITLNKNTNPLFKL